jgi:acetolactate synthase regulatory subunit
MSRCLGTLLMKNEIFRRVASLGTIDTLFEQLERLVDAMDRRIATQIGDGHRKGSA